MADDKRQVVIDYLKDVGLDDLYARDLEIGIYNWCIDMASEHDIQKSWKDKMFLNLYSSKSRSILSNIDKDSYIKNARLIERIKEKEFKPHELPFMDVSNVFPEKWNEFLDMRLKQEQNFYNSKQVAKTDMFKCGKCKKTECSYYELQIRSADESSTIFVTCLNCGNRFRIG
jgi:DNA-directed RNA polymerase subunit M/transcription elongation factor TFIIS